METLWKSMKTVWKPNENPWKHIETLWKPYENPLNPHGFWCNNPRLSSEYGGIQNYIELSHCLGNSILDCKQSEVDVFNGFIEVIHALWGCNMVAFEMGWLTTSKYTLHLLYI